MRRLLLVGDPPSTGGAALQHDVPYVGRTNGIDNVLIGGEVFCEACNSTGTIVKAGGLGRRLGNGREIALEGDILHCRCLEHPVMMSKNAAGCLQRHDDEIESMRPFVNEDEASFCEQYRFIATGVTSPATDAAAKEAMLQTDTIEVLVSDSRLKSTGSQFGHVAIEIDGQVYGRAPDAWDQDSREHYLFRQQVKVNRDTVGFILRASAEDKKRLVAEIRVRKDQNKKYDLAMNSCSSNAAELLGMIGIIAYDPRWTVIPTPADIAIALKKSKHLVRINFHAKAK